MIMPSLEKTLLTLLLFPFLGFVSCENKEVAKLIEDPELGDLYEIKLDDNKYTVYRVSTITYDSLAFRPHNKIVSDKKEIKALIQEDKDNIYEDKRGLYQPESVGYSKETLKKLLSDGTVLNVNRMTRFRKAH